MKQNKPPIAVFIKMKYTHVYTSTLKLIWIQIVQSAHIYTYIIEHADVENLGQYKSGQDKTQTK